MKYSDEELKIIHEKRPDLIRQPDPSTNNAAIEFLKRHDFFFWNAQKFNI